MGQHTSNPNVQAVKRGELKPRVKAERAPSKREAQFLALWAKAIARRPVIAAEASETLKQQRLRHRKESRALAAQIRRVNQLAQQTIRERKKAARRKAA